MEFIGAIGAGKSRHPPLLIMPALSIGNVGQLAADLLVSSYSVSKAGYLDDPFVLPCIGNDPFGPEASGSLSVSLEVFEDAKGMLAILQQRSPVIKGKMVEYAKHVAEWAKSTGVEEIVILSGLDAGKRQRRDMVGSPQIQYISTETPDGSDELCNQLGWKRWEHTDHLLQHHQSIVSGASTSSSETVTDENYYAGLPFATLYSACKARGLKVLCVLSFCSEGDNIPDGFSVAEALHKLLQLKSSSDSWPATLEGGGFQWRIPISWQTVYGPPPDDSIF